MSVGVVVVGHGCTASALLAAARGILGPQTLPDVVAVDAGEGETPDLSEAICAAIDTADQGRGVAILVDLVGASPCNCAQRQGDGHEIGVVAGLNLAMLLKLAALDRRTLGPAELASACADTGQRAVTVRGPGEASADVRDKE